MFIVATLNIQDAILGVWIVIARLPHRAWVDEDSPFLITVGCIIRSEEMLYVMRNMRVTANNVVKLCKALVIHLVNAKLAPVWVIQIAMHKQE